jgi:hypothetical protein
MKTKIWQCSCGFFPLVGLDCYLCGAIEPIIDEKPKTDKVLKEKRFFLHPSQIEEVLFEKGVGDGS